MTRNNEDRIAWDGAWRAAAEGHPEMAAEVDANTYDHDDPTPLAA